MPEAVSCPVPQEQRPLEEFQQLCESWFFSWPAGQEPRLSQRLAGFWLLMLPVCSLIASGSWTLKQDPPRLLAAAAVAALVLPLLLLVRQWLGWTYVMQRLLRESVDYGSPVGTTGRPGKNLCPGGNATCSLPGMRFVRSWVVWDGPWPPQRV